MSFNSGIKAQAEFDDTLKTSPDAIMQSQKYLRHDESKKKCSREAFVSTLQYVHQKGVSL